MQVVNRKMGRREGRAGARMILCVVMALGLMLPAANASARSRGAAITVMFVEGAGVVQGGAEASFTRRCPPTAPHAVAPEFGSTGASPDGQLVLTQSFPRGVRGWTVVVKNLSTLAQGYYAGVSCVGAPGARFAAVRSTAVIDAQRDGGDFVTCPRSAPSPLSSTFQLQPGAAPGSLAVDQMLYGVDGRGRPDHSQFGGMRNLTDTPVGVVVGASCTSLPTHSPEFSSTVQPGVEDGFYSSCPHRGEFAVSGQFSAIRTSDGGAIALDGFGGRQKGQWIVGARNLTSRAIPYFGGPVCIG
jgi:hypothetical protein